VFGQLYGGFRAANDVDDQGQLQRRLMRLQARTALDNGRERATEARRQGQQVRGFQTARAAAQGLEIGTGSAEDLAFDSGYTRELDALAIRNAAIREAWGYNQQGRMTRAASRSQKYGLRRQAFNSTLAMVTKFVAGGMG